MKSEIKVHFNAAVQAEFDNCLKTIKSNLLILYS